ncbi:MAG TPA: DNA repair protein RadA [Anaerolineales bacterium]|nr:DNA repair protein RadA [Anaerolineales bacterium]
MARTRVQYVCQQCGRAAAKPLGRCPQCGAWNSMVSETVAPSRPATRRASGDGPVRLAEIQGAEEVRYPLSIEEFARVLGGGVVPGSLVLVGGDPGIGKSTLLLQMALVMADTGRVLYVSGEESVRQIQSRARRLPGGDSPPDDLYLLTETDLGAILAQVQTLQPRIVVIDSIQTVQVPELDTGAGSISQVREAALRLQAQAKSSDAAVFVVGHVTKDGAIAGPKVLEHIVDTVLYLEGDPLHAFRLLRAVKNRFGPTTEVGVFAMGEAGMVEVPNPSEAFLAERVLQAPGSAVAVTMEGTRPLLVEIQGLTSPTAFGNPRRTANGVDFNRLLLTLAVLTRRVGLRLADQDVFVNVVGGLRLEEPAADLAVAVAVASSLQDKALPADLAFVGEVGLTGELRSVSQMPTRLREAAKLGFRRVIVPKSLHTDQAPAGIEVIAVRSVREALDRSWAP